MRSNSSNVIEADFRGKEYKSTQSHLLEERVKRLERKVSNLEQSKRRNIGDYYRGMRSPSYKSKRVWTLGGVSKPFAFRAMKSEPDMLRVQILKCFPEPEIHMANWNRELAHFKKMKNHLLKDVKYGGKFVAIKEAKIIDSDLDDLRLAKRIDQKYPDEVVLIVKAEEEFPSIEEPSPEFVK